MDVVPTQFEYIARILRMGTKYNISTLRRLSLRFFTKEYPMEMEDYFERGEQWTEVYESSHDMPHVEMLALARQLDIPSMLPAIFLDICQLPDQQLHDSLECPQLSPSDRWIIIKGIVKLIKAHQRMYKFTKEPTVIDDCKSKTCNINRARFPWSPWSRSPKSINAGDDEDGADFLGYHLSRRRLIQANICAPCAAECQKIGKKERAALWRDLPSFFGLPPWSETREEETDTISDTDDVEMSCKRCLL